ncbi:DUF4190 domain-containing protein [Akkermansiaceae bacterium]|nr:DUF4190 domain-containing protein [Akkermansiaceae bacterium]MDB4294360.1 DUF4190 domain-containing protein [Akkermansiaceae bacterium]
MDQPHQPPTIPEVPPSQNFQEKPKTSGLAIASLICGLAGFILTIFTGIPAIVMGHMALSRIKASGGTIGGGGIALAGTILGYITSILIFFIAVLAGLATPAILKAKNMQAEAQLISQVKMVGLELEEHLYETGAYPESPGELPLIKNYVEEDWYYFPATDGGAAPNQPILVSPISQTGFVFLRVNGSVAVQKETEFQATISQGQGKPVVIPATH